MLLKLNKPALSIKRIFIKGRGKKAEKAKREVSEASRQLSESSAALTKLYQQTINSRFYICLVFQTAQQASSFARQTGAFDNTLEHTFLDGRQLAKKMGIVLPPGPDWKPGKPKPLFSEIAVYLDVPEDGSMP